MLSPGRKNGRCSGETGWDFEVKSLLLLTHTSTVNILWKKVQGGFVETLPAPKEKEEGVRHDWLCWFCQMKPWAVQEAELHGDWGPAGNCCGFETSW